MGGESRCEGDLEGKQEGEWRPVVNGGDKFWTLKTAGVLCRDLDCGSAVSFGEREESSERPVWMTADCDEFGSYLRECAESQSSRSTMNLTCSGREEL